MENLADFLAAQREKFEKQRADAQHLLDEATAELRALDAYEAAKQGKPVSTPTRRGPSPGTKRDTGKRAEVLDIIRRTPEGMTAGQVIDALGISDKSGKQSVANALSALKGDGLIVQEVKRGPYKVAP